MEKLIKILEEIKPGVDFKNETSLVSDGILVSFDIVSIVAAISDSYDIEVGVKDIVPENFESANAIYEMIRRLED